MTGGSGTDLRLRSDRLEVAVSPRFGGGVTSVRDRASGAEVLWQTPWAGTAEPPPTNRPLEVLAWCRHSRGGWQVLLPNGGDDGEWQGVRHGFHGEASVAGWLVGPGGPDRLTLTLGLTTAPIDAERTITVRGADVVVRDRLTNRSGEPVELMWTHHPGLGGDLLAGAVTVDTNARVVRLDDRAPVVGAAAAPGDIGGWPHTDLRHPRDGSALLAYLHDFAGPPWVSVVRDDGRLGVRLSWDGATFPHCWLWQELGGTTGPPWYGVVRVIGVEPATSWPGQGLAHAAATGTAYRLAGRATTAASVTLSVLTAVPSVPGESP